MSTRCQVVVIQEGLGWDEKVTLYHHSDGYPSNIIPLIKKAFEYKGEYTNGWEKGRAGKVSSFLCWADPGAFEPEDGHELHGDIEYLYRLFVVNQNMGSIGESPRWEVEILVPKAGFWENCDQEHLKVSQKRTPLDKVKIED